jgi:predicted HTH transcriptional regulator
MAQADQSLVDLVEHGREERNLEYKGTSEGQGFAWGPATVNAKIARTVIAMANIGGGATVIGMDKDGPDRWRPNGVSEDVDLSYQQDEILQYVNERAQPPVQLSVYHVSHGGRRFVIIQIAGFTDLPIVCSKGVGKELRRSAMYVRRHDEEQTGRCAGRR